MKRTFLVKKDPTIEAQDNWLIIHSDSQRDVAHLRKRYFAQKNDGN